MYTIVGLHGNPVTGVTENGKRDYYERNSKIEENGKVVEKRCSNMLPRLKKIKL